MKLADMQSDLEDELDDEDLTTEERAEIIDGYQPDIDEIKERIADLNEELENNLIKGIVIYSEILER